MGRVECCDEASNEKRKLVRDNQGIRQRPSTDRRFTRGYPDTHTCTCTTNSRSNNSTNNAQAHTGPYAFTRSSFTTAWREQTTPSSSSSSSLSLCFLCPCFVVMLFTDKWSCVRPKVAFCSIVRRYGSAFSVTSQRRQQERKTTTRRSQRPQ